jgi:DNA polymerase I-like protein with 3'-5' exonuclease and polymerase domains
MILNAQHTDSYLSFNSRYPRVFAEIERTGLCVNDSFRDAKLVTAGKVYSNYHYHTVTGRPSNAFRGFNFAAMNKEDGTRDAFCSQNGALVEMDFDAYHVRLIARLIGYELPAGSVHEYFGRFYFDTATLTEEQYEQSKQITFRLLYGGIDKEFLEIPYFRQVNDLIWKLWDDYKKRGYITTPVEKRPITMEGVERVSANKLFNYYLQALETEVSVRKMETVVEYLQDKQSKLILYTYDSLLFDIATTEAREIVPALRTLIQEGNFPVKVKYGSIYSKMKTI